MGNQAKIDVLKLNDGKGNMAFIFRDNAYPITVLAGFHWSVLLCIYSILICPFIASVPIHTLLSLYATTIILTALFIRPAHNRADTPRKASDSPTKTFCTQLLTWTLLGSTIAAFNYLTFDFPPGSAEKIIIGFGFLGIYNAVIALLKNPHTQLTSRQLQTFRFWLRYGVIILPVIIAVMTIWMIDVQLATDWSAHQLTARTPEQIIFTSTLFMLLVAILISQNLLRSGFRVLNSQARQLLLNIDQRAHQLNPAHHCEFESIRQPDTRIINNPAYQQKIAHRLRALKYLDPVTETHNIRFIQDFLRNRQKKEPGLELGFLLIQIKAHSADNHVNCQHASDVLQAKTAQHIQQFLLPEDILARLDNNCFAIIPANPARLDESKMARQLNQTLSHEPLPLNGCSAFVKCQISKQFFSGPAFSGSFSYASVH